MLRQRFHYKILAEIVAIVVFIVPIVVFFLPLLQSPSDTYINGYFAHGHLWSWNLIVENLVKNGHLVIFSKAVNYPTGSSITVIGWSFIIPLLLLNKIGIGIFAGTNILILTHIFLACYCAYRLALKLTGFRSASAAAGIAFGYSPFAMSMLWSGQWPKLSYWLIPLALLLFVKIFEKGGVLNIILLGLCAGLALASSPYVGIIILLILFFAGLFFFLFNSDKYWKAKYIKRVAWATFSVFLGLLPFTWYWISSFTFSSSRTLFVPTGIDLENPFPDAHAKLIDWFVPGKVYIDTNFKVVYIGWSLLIFSLFALIFQVRVKGRIEKSMPPFVTYFFLLGAIFFLMALGPLYHYLPMYWVYRLFPITQNFAVSNRAAIGVTLCVALMTAFGIVQLVKWLQIPKWNIVAISILAMTMFFAETLYMSPVNMSFNFQQAKVAQVYSDLAKINDMGAVMEVPCEVLPGVRKINLEEKFFHQIFHKHPIVHRDGPMDGEYMETFVRELIMTLGHMQTLNSIQDKRSKYLTFKYLILNTNDLIPIDLHPVVRFLDRSLELLKDYHEEGYRLYRSYDLKENDYQKMLLPPIFILKYDLPDVETLKPMYE